LAIIKKWVEKKLQDNEVTQIDMYGKVYCRPLAVLRRLGMTMEVNEHISSQTTEATKQTQMD